MSATELIAKYRKVESTQLIVGEQFAEPMIAVDPAKLDLTVESGAGVHLLLLHTSAGESEVNIEVREGGSLELTELFAAEAFADVMVRQQAASRCRITSLELGSANARYRMVLEGHDAESEFSGAFVASANEHSVMQLRTEHNVADCRSNSTVKGVAAGEAVGEFSGMVYVAPDAQRTDARQQSRNILLSETARIDTKPQLEIYADDVKCTHGATVGQMDSEAILYMRQRGIDEATARRIQVSGFVEDVVRRCSNNDIAEALTEAVTEKMERL